MRIIHIALCQTRDLVFDSSRTIRSFLHRFISAYLNNQVANTDIESAWTHGESTLWVTPAMPARTEVTPEEMYLHLIGTNNYIIWRKIGVTPELHARTGATPEQVYLHLVIIYYLTQDWSYPRTACPNWSYPRTGVFAFSNNNYVIWRNIGVTPELHARTRATPEQV